MIKNTFFSLFLILTSFWLNGQRLELTDNGFVDSDNSSNSYIVIDFPGQTQEEIYDQIILSLTQTYKSAKDVMTTVENKAITINAFAKEAVRRNRMHVFNLKYNVLLSFKDEKMKFEVPNIEMDTRHNRKFQQLFIKHANAIDGAKLGIYNKKGKLKSKLAKQDLENFFNKKIDDLKSSSISDDDW